MPSQWVWKSRLLLEGQGPFEFSRLVHWLRPLERSIQSVFQIEEAPTIGSVGRSNAIVGRVSGRVRSFRRRLQNHGHRLGESLSPSLGSVTTEGQSDCDRRRGRGFVG